MDHTGPLYILAAKELYEDPGVITIDMSAPVRRIEGKGAYVAAWVWVADAHIGPSRTKGA